MTVGLLASSVLLGLVFSATPGAVNTESLRRGIARGFWAGLLVQLGSLTGDMIWAALALTGTAFLTQNRNVALLLGLIGAVFLLRQAWSAFRGAARPGTPPDVSAPGRADFVTGTLFSLTNPFAIAFWLGLGAGITATAHTGFPATAGFFGGFLTGAVIWCVGFATLVSVGRRYLTTPLLRAIEAAAGVALTYFGVRLFVKSVQALRVLRFVRAFVG